MIYCPHCGVPNDTNQKTCVRCGGSLYLSSENHVVRIFAIIILLVLLLISPFYVILSLQETPDIITMGKVQDHIAVYVISMLQTRDQTKTAVTLDVINYGHQTAKKITLLVNLYDRNHHDFDGVMTTENLTANTTRRLEFTVESPIPQDIYQYEVMIHEIVWGEE